jgi:hypothetical protein
MRVGGGIVEGEGCSVMCADRPIWLEEELHDETRGTGWQIREMFTTFDMGRWRCEIIWKF